MRDRKGIPLDAPLRVRGVCSVEGCGLPHAAKGYCDGHFRQSRRGQITPLNSKSKSGRDKALCTFRGCRFPHLAKGLCNAHYQQQAKGKKLSPLREGIQWAVTKSGYVRGYFEGRALAQHRVVMAEVIGRPLKPNETPHHKNGVRHDNRPENLELWVKSQPAGQRAVDLLAWAREIIETYEPLEEKL